MQQYVTIVQNDANSANHSAQRSWRRATARDAGGGERLRAAQPVAIDFHSAAGGERLSDRSGTARKALGS
eukprot:172095-Pleurochrysis_carterae.AAC.2